MKLTNGFNMRYRTIPNTTRSVRWGRVIHGPGERENIQHMKSHRAVRAIIAFVATIMVIMVCAVIITAKQRPKQLVPDPKRQTQIRQALVEHGYPPGRTWPQTQDILRQIAREHHWQHTHAPDARVLIFLGLGNKYSDPNVLNETNRLEQ